ncbi:MAG: diadenylate cyclase CdaA [Clostridium sp.]|nr:diadenylate cyclase CdaA [Clostridium sp.]MCM1172916.1 diadenylate cyclase CdaA [Clostridium sp.]MCM1208594.1 diadenylate cyclase CdaA [Ruminococcus sp.]
MKKILAEIISHFDWLYLPKITIADILEIIILSYLLYHIILWFKNTRAWTLLKGIAVLLILMSIAYVFKLNTLMWIFKNTINVGILAVIILFQPELRRALEELGRKKLLADVIIRDDKNEKNDKLSAEAIQELVAASIEMSKNKTGALIVVEQEVALGEYVSTGINIDAAISKQLIVNIFEHNTPLHDGAVIIRNNRIIAATCYLPLTGRVDLNKDLGTRHRAAVGISEVSDSITIIVSEETGAISVAQGGTLTSNLDPESLRKQFTTSLPNKATESRRQRRRKKGGKKNEKKAVK